LTDSRILLVDCPGAIALAQYTQPSLSVSSRIQKFLVGFPAGEYPFKHQPIPARDVPEAFERICDECQKILSDKNVRVLYIIPAFTVDTIHVQPFEKEGQLLIRLLLLHMLHNAKFPIFEYTCFEHLIHENIVRLYSTVEKCMLHWEQEINDYRLAFDFWVDLLQKSCSLL